jgi:type II restriction enzyme
VTKPDRTLNKGESSEFYSFVYILANQEVPLVDKELVPIGNDTVRFLRLYRSDNNVYTVLNDGSVRVVSENDSSVVSREDLQEMADRLLLEIKGNRKISADCPAVTDIMGMLKTTQISAKGQDKSDFTAEVITPGAVTCHALGFSVKSQMGNSATLINANKLGSQFQYKIVKEHGYPLTEADKETVRAIAAEASQSKQKQKLTVQRLYANGFRLQFVKTTALELSITLAMMDSLAPKIIAEMLVEHYRSEGSVPLRELVLRVVKEHALPELPTLGRNDDEISASLMYKVKHILLNFSTGATVSHVWDGKDRASGGFLVVKKNGEVVCLELYTRDTIGEYLVRNTRFETPSSHRHPSGDVREDKDGLYFDLQLQVRFID